MTGRRPLTHPTDMTRTPNPAVQFHRIHSPPSARLPQASKWRSFTPRQSDYSTVSVVQYCSGIHTFDKEFSISRNTARKIYLSRSRWNHHLRLPGEPRIETIFSDYGYEIIHPQDLSIPKQIATICGAGRLAGSQGSALHWSLLSPDCRSVLALGSPLPQQRGICRSRGQELVELRGRKPSIGTVRQRLVGDATIHQALARLSD